MDEELQEYYDEVVLCLVRYGGVGEIEAKTLTDESGLLNVSNETDRYLLFHEYPYYWAMAILHGKTDPQWHLNPALWPPPDDYFEWVKAMSKE